MSVQSIRELKRLLQTKKLSVKELVHETYKNLEKNPFGAVLDLNLQASIDEAEKVQNRINQGEDGSLLGIPVVHKDVLVTKKWKTTAGSKFLKNYVSAFDATVVKNLFEAGMVCVGKASCDEFAMGSANQNCAYGKCSNPWDQLAVPGGSSGGSAALVGGNFVPVATGTDTGGSIRQPAAMCGISGLKPTYGRVSRWGLIAYASSLDQAGPLTKSAYDCGLVMNSMAGYDMKDSTSFPEPNPDFCKFMNEGFSDSSIVRPLEKVSIGIPKEYLAAVSNSVLPAFQEAIRTFEFLGASIREISLPSTPYSVAAYYVIAPAEASSNLAKFDGIRFGQRSRGVKSLEELYTRSRTEGFGEEVKKRILVGTFVLSHGYYDAYYLQALKVRNLVIADFDAAFKECNFILSPTSPVVAWDINGSPDLQKSEANFEGVPKEYLADILTVGASLAGLPAISIPCGILEVNNRNRPIGLQIIGKRFEEPQVLQVANAFQTETHWHTLSSSEDLV